MSDLMLIGVLRMPVTPQSDELTMMQYIDRGRQAADLIEQQAAEIDALKAHVERLRSIAFPYIDLLPELVDWFDDTPYQSLAEHDAEIARKAFIAGMMNGFNVVSNGGLFDADEAATDYVNKLRQSGNG